MPDSSPDRAALDDLHASVKPLLTWKSPVLGGIAFLFVTLPFIHGRLAAWIAAHTQNQTDADLWVATVYLFGWAIFLLLALVWDAVVRRRFAAEQARLTQAKEEGASRAYKDVHEKLGAMRATVTACSYAMITNEDLNYFNRVVRPLKAYFETALEEAIRAGSVERFDSQLRNIGQGPLAQQYRALGIPGLAELAADPREHQIAAAESPLLDGLQPGKLKTLAQSYVVRLDKLTRMIELIDQALVERYQRCMAAFKADDPSRALQAFTPLR